VEDQQLTIAGVPTDGGRRGHRSSRSVRATSGLRPLSGGVTAQLAHGSGECPASSASSRSARPRPPVARDVHELGVRTDLVTACRIALGVGSTTAYALAGRGELPFPAYRVGRQWVVPTAGLRAFLGLPQ
jgi:hypothetical protein